MSALTGSARRRLRIDVSYDGSRFHGWQVQPGKRTVQGELEDVFRRLAGGRAVGVQGAGRTDAGVHALAQVADCWLESRLGDEGLLRALSGMLPRDLRPRAVATVPGSFNARRDAVRKTYRYRLDRSSLGDPLLSSYALHHPYSMHRGAIEAALARLPGTRDWSGFAGSACDVEDRVRTMTRASFDEQADEAWFGFTASGFLNHMVRNLVGTLLEVGRGSYTADRIDRILDSGDRRLAGPTAAARGLILWEVGYPSAERGPANGSVAAERG